MFKKVSEALVSRRDFLRRGGKYGMVAAAVGAAAIGTEVTLKHIGETQNGDAKMDPAHEIAIPTFCAMCGPSQGCGINAIVRDGKMIRVEGRKESALNRGRLCAKAHASVQWLYSPQRLKYPMRRTGERGEGKFERISWDKALDILVEKLKEQKEKYGPESLAILSPAHRTYSTYLYRFLTAHGSPNYGHSGICAMQKAFGFAYTLGSTPNPDIANTNLYVIWAKQPVYAGSSKGGVRSLLAAKERGAKIVSIKPTMEPDVAHSDKWIPIRPGTDAAFALAVLHVVIGEGLYDHGFVHQWTHGFEQLTEHVKKYSPEWASPITGLPAKEIRDFARLYATTKPACIEVGNGLEHATSCSDAVRAIAILSAITGNLGKKGGDLLSVRGGPGGGHFTLSERYTQEWVDKLVGPEFPRPFQPFSEGTSTAYYRIFESVLTEKPYPIRTIIAPGTQPTVTTRGTARVLEALKKVDFFVVVDVMRTAEIDYADLVIPVASMYEIDHPFEGAGPNLEARNRVVKPLGDYKSDYEFWLELGTRMGYGKDFWNGSIEACMDEQLKPQGITYAELRKRKHGAGAGARAGGEAASASVRPAAPPGGAAQQNAVAHAQHAGASQHQPLAGPAAQAPHGGPGKPADGGKPGAPAGPQKASPYENYEEAFAARSTRFDRGPYLPEGKVAIYNTTFEKFGFSPLPEWREPPESPTATPELLAKYPLTFSDFHTSKVYNAGWLRNIPYLREILPDPTLQMHPHTAAERKIKHGDTVIVESPYGSLTLVADVNPGIRPDTVMALHGWWQGCSELKKKNSSLLAGGANANSMYSTDPAKAYDPLVTAMTSQTLVQVRKA